jgi:hypothetical protein
VQANKVYPFPGIQVMDTASLLIIASPLNAGNILISRRAQPTVFNSVMLQPGRSISYRCKNAKIFSCLGTAAGDNVILTCELGG